MMTKFPEEQLILGRFFRKLARRYLTLEAWLHGGDDDISKSEFQVLELILLSEARTVSEIAQIAHVPLSTASWLVNRLVDKAYLTREQDEQDRRKVHLKATEKSSELIVFLEEAFAMAAAELLAQSTPEESAIVVRMAQRYLEQLE